MWSPGQGQGQGQGYQGGAYISAIYGLGDNIIISGDQIFRDTLIRQLPSSIFTSTTLVCVYLHKILLLEVNREQRNTVGLFEHWCTIVSAVAIHTHQCYRGLIS